MLQGRHHTQLDAHPEPSPDPELPGAGNQGSHTAASCLPSLECAGLGWINSLTSITWQTYYRKKTSPIINWCAEQTFPKVYVKEKKKDKLVPRTSSWTTAVRNLPGALATHLCKLWDLPSWHFMGAPFWVSTSIPQEFCPSPTYQPLRGPGRPEQGAQFRANSGHGARCPMMP